MKTVIINNYMQKIKVQSPNKSAFIKYVLLLLASIYFHFSGYGQDNPTYLKMPRVIFPSGDAGALGRYGDYPVDKNTGVPSISVPVFEIQVNGYKLPLNLSYHASGNRVDDISSVVGLGWSLNAGGCITRTVKGKPDEANKVIAYRNIYDREYETREELNNYSTSDSIRCRLNNLIHGDDLEADLYSFNFNGYSGQFTHDSNNNLILMAYEDIKISGGPISGYTINTPDGAKYMFFDGDSTVVSTGSYKSCWYLNEIITPNLDTITFKYSSTGYIQGDHQPSFNCVEWPWNVHSDPWKYIDFIDIDHLRYLSNVTFKNGKVNFGYGLQRKDMRPHQLQSITVLDTKGKTIKRVDLGQSYFVSDTSDPVFGSSDKYKNRLKLDNVKFVNPDNPSDIQTYSFEYNTTKLPPYFEAFGTPYDNNYYSQDFWGYYNNAQTNQHLMPIANLCGVTAANRNVDEEAMQSTILKKITFPAGGRTELEYEANRNQGVVEKLGGLRIKTIKNFADSPSAIPSMVKSYEYPTGGFPTSWVSHRSILDRSRWVYDNTLNSTLTTNYIATPIGNLSYNNGLIAIYDKVWEFTGANKEIKTEYNYSVLQEDSYDSHFFRPNVGGTHFYPVYFKDEAYRSGHLISQIDYKKEGNDYRMVREISNIWTPYSLHEAIVGIKIVPIDPSVNWCSGSGSFPDDLYQYFNIIIQSGVKKLTQTVEKLYTGSEMVEKTTDFEYSGFQNTEAHGFVTKETITSSSEEKIWKKSRYLPDVFTNPTGVYAVMKDKYMISNPLEIINGRNANATDYYLSSSVYNFDFFASQPKLNQIKQMKLESLSTTYSEWTDSRLKTETTVDSYDKNGNILNVTPKDNIPTGYQWGYKNAYPVAKAVNAKNLVTYVDQSSSSQLVFGPNDMIAKETTFASSTYGDITLNVGFGGNQGSNHTANFTFTLTGPLNQTGSVCLSSGTGCSSYPSTITYHNMPLGTYHLSVVPNINDASSNVNFVFTYQKQTISSSGIIEFYYQGFEEYTGATKATAGNPSYAGNYYNAGAFYVTFIPPNGRSYVVDYHYWNGTKWISVKKPYTSLMTLTEGTAIDEVRVYPSDAQMTTYTYDPLIGMTSSTNENNVTTFYEYDSFGRLICIRDQNKNILKTYDYHYKYQVINP